MLLAMVNLFFDKKNNVLVIPIWRDKDGGFGRDSIEYSELSFPYTEKELGAEIEKCLEISRLNAQEDKEQKVYLVAGKVKSWRAFQKKYESVTISNSSGDLWKITKDRKMKDGSYGLDKDDLDKYKRTFTEQLSTEQLVKIVLEMQALK